MSRICEVRIQTINGNQIELTKAVMTQLPTPIKNKIATITTQTQANTRTDTKNKVHIKNRTNNIGHAKNEFNLSLICVHSVHGE